MAFESVSVSIFVPSLLLSRPAIPKLTPLTTATLRIQLLDSPRSCETMPLTKRRSGDDSERSGLLSRTPSVPFPKFDKGRVYGAVDNNTLAQIIRGSDPL